MKTLKQNMWWFALVLLLMSSCKKEPLIETDSAGIAISETYNSLSECLVTHTEDNWLGSSLDFFYNAQNRIDSIQVNKASILIPGYDKFGRLITINFVPGDGYANLKYNGSEKLPSEIDLYISNSADLVMKSPLHSIFQFKYNNKSETVQMQYTDLWSSTSGFSYYFDYNADGNLTSVTTLPQSGGRSQDGTLFTEYTFTKYDARPNLMGDNPWLKYMLLFTGSEPYNVLALSKNNPVNWTWQANPSYPACNVVSTFDYNANGFARKASLHITQSDGATIGDFARVSYSTCDKHYQKSGYAVLEKIPILSKGKMPILPKNHIASGIIMETR